MTAVPINIKVSDVPLVYETESYKNFVGYMKESLGNTSRIQFMDKLSKCVSCEARKEATSPVLPEGDINVEIVLQGRNPGRQENQYGRPFFPEAPGGKWFGYYLEALSTHRNSVYITNSLFCYTKQDRPPVTSELATCVLWKSLEFSYIPNLKYLFLLGNDALRQSFSFDFPSVVKIFGDVYQTWLQGKRIMVFPCYHPAYVLRNPALAEHQFSYLKSAKVIIDEDRKGNLKWLI